MEPEPEGPAADVEARIRADDWSLAVLAAEAGLIAWQEPVAAELAALPSPYFRLHREADGAKAPRLEVSLISAESDSLDGLHFATLRGTLRLPDGGARPVTGKGGHTDPAKARKRAARDFAVQVGKRLAKIER